MEEHHRLYFPYWLYGVTVDVISASRLLSGILNPKTENNASEDIVAAIIKAAAGRLRERYDIILLPVPMLLPDAFPPLLEAFVALGGSVWISFRSDLKDETGKIRRSRSRLASLAGVKIEEFEALGKKKIPLRASQYVDPKQQHLDIMN